MNDIVLSAEHLKKSYLDDSGALDVLIDVNFEVLAGETVAILGRSGSGKSTLLHLLGGLDTLSAGSVHLMGRELSLMRERERSMWRNKHLGFVYQFHHLLPEFNTWENVAMPMWVAGDRSSAAREKAQDMLKRVGLQDRMQHRVTDLSGGERQRVALGACGGAPAQLCFADEPTGNLDEESAANVDSLVQGLNKSLGTSFVVVTHNQDLAAQMQRRCTLEQGILQEA